MLFGLSDYVQSVVLQGSMYVGSGWCRKRSDNNYLILKFEFEMQKWKQVSISYTARDFAMVAVEDRLVLVGGCDPSNRDTNLLGMLSPDESEWQRPYKPMPTARHNASAMCFNGYLIVAGGLNKGPVELLDIRTNQWTCVPGLAPWHSMKSTMVGHMWYLMGGYTNHKATSKLFAVSLPSLVQLATATDSDRTFDFEYKELCGTGLNFSSPVNIRECLFAVGGKQDGTREKSIKCLSSSGRWQDVGKLPWPLFNSTCTCYNGSIYIAAGTMELTCSKIFIGLIP